MQEGNVFVVVVLVFGVPRFNNCSHVNTPRLRGEEDLHNIQC